MLVSSESVDARVIKINGQRCAAETNDHMECNLQSTGCNVQRYQYVFLIVVGFWLEASMEKNTTTV